MEWEYSNYSNVDAKVKEAFPFSSARENQLETISEVKHAIEKGYKYIVLEQVPVQENRLLRLHWHRFMIQPIFSQ